MKKLMLSLVALAGLLLVVAWMAGYFRPRIAPGLSLQQVADSGNSIPVVQDTVAVTESVPASIEAREATIISSRLLARITAIRVRAGDYVEQGELLLTLEKSDLDARRRQAEERARAVTARLVEAQQNLERAEELHQRGLIAVAARDAARADAAALAAELSSAEQALQEAETAAGFSEIRSPIAGRVVDRFAEPGDTATPGAKLLSLYNPFSLRVEARVREQLALSLRPGQVLSVTVPSAKARFDATVEEIVPAADPGSRSFLVKATAPAGRGLLPGLYAQLVVPAGERTRLLVPADRVAEVGQLNVVWVATETGAERRFVRLGEGAVDGRLEVIAGLTDGDRLLPPPGPGVRN